MPFKHKYNGPKRGHLFCGIGNSRFSPSNRPYRTTIELVTFAVWLSS